MGGMRIRNRQIRQGCVIRISHRRCDAEEGMECEATGGSKVHACICINTAGVVVIVVVVVVSITTILRL